ncbi:hypothetical protein [Rudanella lutea]|uniref:hypothetical protein n=1 Tax=Rudanella lutea TaxID=451374 RepID=UPI00035CBD11|nr:hypothetical protein [Rudanella lutea]
MRLFTRCFLLFLLIGLFTQCKRETDPAPVTETGQTELLTTNPWRVDRVTDTGGKEINKSALGLETAVLFELLFQFNTNKVVRAINLTTRQIINAGDWSLVDNNTALDIQVTGFKGKFKIIQLTRQTLILQQDQVQVNGTKQVANLVFVPNI